MNCHFATKRDAEIASLIVGWDANDVARLRGMWEDTHKGKTFDVSDPMKAAMYLSTHHGEILSNVLKTSAVHMAKSYARLKETYISNPEAKMDRINMIATLFSSVLDKWQAAGDTHSRNELCNGYKDNEGIHGGQFKIFEIVYNQLRNQYKHFVATGDDYSAEEIEKVLDNWSALTVFARIILRDTEGLKLGNSVEYSYDTDMGNFNENDLTSIYNPEESTRESWQEMNDFISAFGTIGKAVRRVLGGIQLYSSDLALEIAQEENKLLDVNDGWVTDDLGFAKKLNPVIAHQILMEELRGVVNESDMLEILRNSRYEWMPSLVKILENNPQIRTQFFVDFSKDFQPYKGMSIELERGLAVVKTYIMNVMQNVLGGEYRARIKRGKPISQYSIYGANGRIDWENIRRLRNIINEWFSQDTKVTGALVSKTKSKFWRPDNSWENRAAIIVDISRALGIDINTTTAIRLLKGAKGTKLTKLYQELFTHTNAQGASVSTGFDALLTSGEIESLNKGDYSTLSKKAKTFMELFKKQTSSQKNLSKKGNIEEKIDKILDLISVETELLKMEGKVLHRDKKGKTNVLFSDVNPSFLGTFVKRINRYAKAKDSKGLKKFLTTQFGDGNKFSSMFYMDGKFLNKWLEEFYNEDLGKEGNFAETFMYSRFLGSDIQDFENFTSKQHAIEMIHEYLFAENSTDSKGKKYGHYPVFVLGDSGVAKYIKAKRYTKEEILEGLYNVYKSERRRMELTKAVNKILKDEGFPNGIENFSEKENEFTILKFLNDKNLQQEINKKVKSGISVETAIKDAIMDYMNSSVKSFSTKLSMLGVLDMQTITLPNNEQTAVLKYFSKEQSQYKGDIDALVEDFYWNTKFATIQQLQLMTIDTGFYKNIKDLQKRYKEIHAPGTILSLDALDFDGKKYSETGIERCAYFDDILVDARKTNPEFMDAIRDHLGEGSAWEEYCSNTLTDGQGYRTLDSYRKVMGMAGLWTKEMENAYKEIKSLRSTYGNNPIPAEELERIAELGQVFMPIKPYMYTFENISTGTDVLKIPVQHKYSEAVLIPELLPVGSKLRDIAYWMENNNVDLIGSTKIVKVGSFGSTDISKASNSEDLVAALNKAYIHQLSYSDYRIQTNVPEHINSSQLFGTQLRKLIMAGIDFDKLYEHYTNGNKVNLGNGQMATMNGRNLINFYNSLIVSNILSSYKEFEKEVGNPKLLSNALQQAIVNNSRESWDNLLAYALNDFGDFEIPLCEGGIEHDATALLLSIFKKKVNKQKIKGGSLVQVSAMGISGYEEDGDLQYVTEEYRAPDGSIKKNILYAEVEVPFDLSVNINGKEVPLKFSDYCNEDGTLKMLNGEPLIEKHFPNILNRIAYRIPTERDYSMINIKIKRFSQKTAGGVIKVPPQGTKIAGFDFDIKNCWCR